MSRGGVLLQSDRPLAPGSKQALEIVGTEKSIVVPFGVLRSKLTAIQAKGPVYRAACAFSRPLELPELVSAAAATIVDEPVADSAVDATPVVAAPAPDLTAPDAAAVAVGPEGQDAAPSPALTPAPAVEAPAIMERIVARFVDGTTKKGFTNDFSASGTQLTLFQSAEPESTSVVVPFQSLKAVFLVRHFAGNAENRERKTLSGPASGRKSTSRSTTARRWSARRRTTVRAGPASTSPRLIRGRTTSGCSSCRAQCGRSSSPDAGSPDVREAGRR